MPEQNGQSMSETVRQIQQEREDGTLVFDPILVSRQVREKRQRGRLLDKVKNHTRIGCGFTTIEREDNLITIRHFGNSGNTVDRSVKPNVDRLLGEDSFEELKEVATSVDESGSPDYSYTMVLTF